MRLVVGALFAALLLVLLIAPPSYAADMDEANELMSQSNGLISETYTLEAQLREQVEKVFAIDPLSEDAATALPLLADAQATIDTLNQKMRSIAALLDRVAALDIEEEKTTYARKQHDVAQAYLQANALSSELLSRYVLVYDEKKRARLSDAELATLDEEILDLETREEKAYERVVQQQDEAVRYYNEHDVGKVTAADGTWAGRGPIGWIVSLVIGSVSATICGLVARKKNRNIIGWAVFGFFIPVAGLIAILVVRKVDLESRADRSFSPRRRR